MRVIIKRCKYFRATTTSVQRVSCRCKRTPSELFFDLSRSRQPPLHSLLCAASHNLFRGGGSATERIFKYTCPDGSGATGGRATLRAVPPGIPRQWRRTRGTTAPDSTSAQGWPRTGWEGCRYQTGPATNQQTYTIPCQGCVGLWGASLCKPCCGASTSVGLRSLADRALGWGPSEVMHAGMRGTGAREQSTETAKL